MYKMLVIPCSLIVLLSSSLSFFLGMVYVKFKYLLCTDSQTEFILKLYEIYSNVLMWCDRILITDASLPLI